VSTPAPRFSSPQEFRDLNKRMAEAILAAEPAPYADGGYVRRVVEIRGRRSGQVHGVPIAVITLAGRQYLVSPRRERNWVKNLLDDPECVVRSRDTRDARRAALVGESGRVTDVVSTYVALMNAPWAVAQFPFPADASRAEIEQAAAGVAVFELKPSDADPGV
jgi:hypothetical protein